jgi:hypothetical protein
MARDRALTIPQPSHGPPSCTTYEAFWLGMRSCLSRLRAAGVRPAGPSHEAPLPCSVPATATMGRRRRRWWSRWTGSSTPRGWSVLVRCLPAPVPPSLRRRLHGVRLSARSAGFPRDLCGCRGASPAAASLRSRVSGRRSASPTGTAWSTSTSMRPSCASTTREANCSPRFPEPAARKSPGQGLRDPRSDRVAASLTSTGVIRRCPVAAASSTRPCVRLESTTA